jgi:superfamily II DNA or RNA helicase/ubiquinone/menaquinone biosynthesis C-methylase UbiE
MYRLRPYQLEAVRDVLEKKRVIIADDMGLGKTAEALAVKSAIERTTGYEIPTLVVSPASVVPHWEREARNWYRKGADTRTTVIQAQTYDQDIMDAENSDISLISYQTLSYLGSKQPKKLKRLEKIGFGYGILDEAHNAKNPESIRSGAVRNLFHPMDYLTVLTGTPIPNSIIDIYSLLNLLDKENFPINSENPRATLSTFYEMFRQNPEFIKDVFHQRMLRREVGDYLGKSFPELRQNTRIVQLDGEHKDVYLDIYENGRIGPLSKLRQLEKACIDPNLVDPQFLSSDLSGRLGKMQSDMYSSLDELVEKVVDENGKLLVFTDLREGVTERLQERYARYGAVVIDMDASSTQRDGGLSVREEIRQKFQKDKKYKVLIATTVMDEGADLTAATDIAHLTLPYTPAVFDQRNRRSQRVNAEVEKDHVNVHIMKAIIDGLIPTICEGKEKLLEDKRKIITYIEKSPFLLSQEDLKEVKNGPSPTSRNLGTFIMDPMASIMRHFGSLRGEGHLKISKRWEERPVEAEQIAKIYASHWEGYLAGNVANLYGRVARILDREEGLERKLDIASGPFSLSRKISEPVTNIDLNPFMLKAGKILEEQGIVVPGNIGIEGSFHDLPFEDGSFDLANFSLALQYSKLRKTQGDKFGERELALREMNRVLKEGGYGIITLPASRKIVQRAEASHLEKGFGRLGFEVLPFSGFYKGPEDTNFRAYLACLRKVDEPQKKSLEPEQLAMKMEEKKAKNNVKSAKKRKPQVPDRKEIEKHTVDLFYDTRSGKPLDEMVMGGIR